MADLSLDDIIRQKNVKVQFRTKQQQQQPKPQVQGKTPGRNPKFQAKNVQRTFDARSKLGPKKIVDARNKIVTNKSNGNGDARSKIVQKQVQKGTFDARSLLKRQGKKTNGAANKPQGPHNNFPAIQPITRTLSNPASLGQFGEPLIRQIPNTEVSFSRNSLQITKRGMGGPPPPAAPLVGDAVPIIQIRNDRYQRQEMPPPQPDWSTTHSAQRLPPQPAHLDMQYSHHSSSSSSYPPTNRSYSSQNSHSYQDLDVPRYHTKPSKVVQEMPRMHISNVKAVEAAGMRPVSSRPIPQSRAPPGAATLSAKQPMVSAPHQAGNLKRRQPAQEVGGPLRLGRGGGPGIQVGIGEGSSPPKRMKVGATAAEPIEITDLEQDSSKFVSPLQGFRVVVTNLFPRVTQEDIIELFGVVGPLKKARLLKAGSSEVVYTTKEDAVKAVQKYHGRELDCQPMYVKMTTPSTAVVKAPPEADPDITGEALRLYKKPSSLGALPVAPIETPTIHRALFKVGPPAPNKSVKFTVKI